MMMMTTTTMMLVTTTMITKGCGVKVSSGIGANLPSSAGGFSRRKRVSLGVSVCKVGRVGDPPWVGGWCNPNEGVGHHHHHQCWGRGGSRDVAILIRGFVMLDT